MKGIPITLPACGMFIGTGVYPCHADYLLCTLHAHQAWMGQTYKPLEMIDRVLADNQGNLIQFWGYARGYAPVTHAEWIYALDEIGIQVPEPDWEKGTYLRVKECREIQEHADRKGAGALRFIRAAAEKGLYTVLLYVDARPEWSRRFQESGDRYLGYDFGERFTFRLDDAVTKGRKLEEITLTMLADDLIARVKDHVDERHASGWGNVMATSCNFYIDYEIAAGTDVPVVEDFAFSHLNVASALSRGLYRQHGLPLWGAHLAHEHYSWIPYASPHKFTLLKAALYQKYMAGCKMVINESGNWFVEATLAIDSPKFEFPRVPLKPKDVSWGGDKPPAFQPYMAEARKLYHKVDYTADSCRQYRREISDFYEFVKANGTPEGQPETTLALAKGNLDLCGHRYSPNAAIGGAFAMADRNPAWFEGAPERGWETVKKVFFPLEPVLGPHPNRFLSGTPFGQADIVSFVRDQVDPAFLSAQYKALLFSGWNTCSEKQYAILRQYVENGGILFIAIPHLSTNATRNYGAYGRDELVRGGDFSDLCGVRVKGRGKRFYWATAPDGTDELGFRFPRRFGIMSTCMGDIEITDPAAETLVVDDEEADPLLLRRRCGKGLVYFLNSWAYPGALDIDEGPGSTLDSPGLVGMIYRHIALKARGSVWITDDRETPGLACNHIGFSFFPQAGRICLHNIDLSRPHRFFLHQAGRTDAVELAPGEFSMRQSEGTR